MSNPRLWFLAPPSLFAALVLILSSFAPSARAAGDANRSECSTALEGFPGLTPESTPGFHSYLPDCRAFELVSPPFTNGQFPLGVWYKAEPPQISADGEHLLSVVLAGFAGSETLEQHGIHFGALYEFSRTPEGWGAEALTPPASLYPRSEFDFASSDFSRMLWSVQLPPTPGEELPPGAGSNGTNAPNNGVLLIREPAGGGKGRFTAVGPVTAPEHEPSSKVPSVGSSFSPEGASADLSHILLRVTAEKKQLWPGDTTMADDQSLYEYVGTGEREPVLVGVSNEGSVVGAAAREGKEYANEASDLISRCGTGLGGNAAGGPMTDAVSASGGIVYFTALACGEAPLVNELYARVDGERTVDISEPTRGAGGDCAACLPGSERYPAVYRGASEDGSEVFFTSEQELLPGATGNSLYEYDFDASNPHERLIRIASEVAGTPVISGDGTRVYFESPTVLSAQANGNGETARQGAPNLYMDDTAASGEPKPVFVTQEAEGPRTTRNGRFLVYTSDRHIAGTNDESVIPQLFEYDTETETNSRVSVGQAFPAGYHCEITHAIEERFGCDGNATGGNYYLPFPLAEQEIIGWWPTDETSGLAVSAEGTVEFESMNALTPLAVPEHENVYEYSDGEVYLLSPGTEAVSPVDQEEVPSLSRLLGIDESGRDAFFATTESLVPQDTNSQTSWYDARIEGGFPAPAEAPSCLSGTCRGPFSSVPSLPVAGGTATATAGGNLALQPPPAAVVKPKPAAKCKKGYVKKKGKCVKKAKAKKASTVRANSDRGGRS
jgi:hypothetical protein